MKPPNLTMSPPNSTGPDQATQQQLQQNQQAQQQTTPGIEPNPTTNNTGSSQNTNSSTIALIASQPTKPQLQPTISASQEQQAPLALTTQPQNRPQLQVTTSQIVQPTNITTQTSINQQVTTQLQTTKIQPTQQLQTNTTIQNQPTQPIALATVPTTTGPTTLVIIPQHSTTTSITSAKPAVIASKTTSLVTATTTAHLALASTTQSPTIQMQAPVTTIVPALAPIPITAHQQSTTLAQNALINRPPQTLPIVPINTTTTTTTVTPTPVNIKQEPSKCVCCLLDDGARCERAAGNASFSARIQKIVGTKKMNYAIDRSAGHTYICEHHKAIITVAKKSVAPREPKANARNNHNNANSIAAVQQQQLLQQQQNHQQQQLHNNNFNDVQMNQGNMSHPMNLEIMPNQSRLQNNHPTVLNNIPNRPGAQIAYGHYQGHLSDQFGPKNAMMPSSFDNTGGDNIIGPSSSGGVDVDLQQLQVNTLRRYKRHFRVQTRPGLNKMQLAESLKGHFRTLPIIEKEAITYFVYIVKCYRNKLDHNPKAD